MILPKNIQAVICRRDWEETSSDKLLDFVLYIMINISEKERVFDFKGKEGPRQWTVLDIFKEGWRFSTSM